MLLEGPGAVVVAEVGRAISLDAFFPEGLTVHAAVVHLCPPLRAVLDRVRWLRRERNIPAVVVGDLTERLAEELVEAGVHGLLPAGVEPDELRQAITVAGAGGYHANTWFKRRLARRGGKRKASGSSDPSPRQLEFLKHLCHPAGYTLEQIAAKMGVSRRTVEAHRDALFLKFGVRKCQCLVSIAKDRRLV